MDSTDVRRLAADLRAAGPVARNRAGVAVRKAAFDVVADAKRKVPVDTGRTRDSIDADFAAVGGAFGAVIGPTTSYAPYLEFGTVHMAPRPFMSPAADRVLPLLEQAIAELGGDVL